MSVHVYVCVCLCCPLQTRKANQNSNKQKPEEAVALVGDNWLMLWPFFASQRLWVNSLFCETNQQTNTQRGSLLGCMCVCLSVCLSASLSVALPLCLSLCLSVCLSASLSLCPSVSLSLCLSVLFWCIHWHDEKAQVILHALPYNPLFHTYTPTASAQTRSHTFCLSHSPSFYPFPSPAPWTRSPASRSKMDQPGTDQSGLDSSSDAQALVAQGQEVLRRRQQSRRR